jgi:ABC-type branched-subunit amino acid transport system substrate-binding protein
VLTRKPFHLRRSVVVPVAALTLLMTVAACGGSSGGKAAAPQTSGSAVSCPGTALTVMTVSTLSGGIGEHPEIPASVKAAAGPINKSCSAGRPINVITCDDKHNPNTSQACAREAVSKNAIAVVGIDGDGAEYALPILKAAGIPLLGFGANGKNGLSFTNSFPLASPVPILLGEAKAAVAMGAKTVTPVVVAGPSSTLLVGLLKSVLEPAGVKVNEAVTTPVDATNMATAAAQLQQSKAGAYVEILTAGPLLQLLTASHALGDKTPMIGATLTITPDILKKWGPEVTNGVYTVGAAIPTTVTDAPGVKDLADQFTAIGEDPNQEGDWGTAAWAGMTLIGKVLAGSGSEAVTGASLTAKLVASGPQDYGVFQPFDLSTNAYPGNPILSKQRVFSKMLVITEIVNGEFKVVSKGANGSPWVDSQSDFTIPQLVK